LAHWWNDSDKEKPKHSAKTRSQRHFVYHKYYMERPGRSSQRQVCTLLIAGIEGLNPVEEMGARLLCLLCRQQPLLHAISHSEESYGINVYLIVCDLQTSTMRRPAPELDCSTAHRQNWKISLGQSCFQSGSRCCLLLVYDLLHDPFNTANDVRV